MSNTALRPMLAHDTMSSWRHDFPAATAFAVALVIGFVIWMSSSGAARLPESLAV